MMSLAQLASSMPEPLWLHVLPRFLGGWGPTPFTTRSFLESFFLGGGPHLEGLLTGVGKGEPARSPRFRVEGFGHLICPAASCQILAKQLKPWKQNPWEFAGVGVGGA